MTPRESGCGGVLLAGIDDVHTGHEIGAEPVRPSRDVVRGADADPSSERSRLEIVVPLDDVVQDRGAVVARPSSRHLPLDPVRSVVDDAVVLDVEQSVLAVVAPETYPRIVVDVRVGDRGVVAGGVRRSPFDAGRVSERGRHRVRVAVAPTIQVIHWPFFTKPFVLGNGTFGRGRFGSAIRRIGPRTERILAPAHGACAYGGGSTEVVPRG